MKVRFGISGCAALGAVWPQTPHFPHPFLQNQLKDLETAVPPAAPRQAALAPPPAAPGPGQPEAEDGQVEAREVVPSAPELHVLCSVKLAPRPLQSCFCCCSCKLFCSCRRIVKRQRALRQWNSVLKKKVIRQASTGSGGAAACAYLQQGLHGAGHQTSAGPTRRGARPVGRVAPPLLHPMSALRFWGRELSSTAVELTVNSDFRQWNFSFPAGSETRFYGSAGTGATVVAAALRDAAPSSLALCGCVPWPSEQGWAISHLSLGVAQP